MKPFWIKFWLAVVIVLLLANLFVGLSLVFNSPELSLPDYCISHPDAYWCQ